MIENEAQLAQVRQVLLAAETSLAALRARVEPDNAGLFHAMAEPYVEDIVRIRAEIDEYLGTAAVMATRAPLWFVLEGAALRQGDVSSLILSSWLAKLRKSVLAVTEYLQAGHLRVAGRPSAALIDATDLRLVALTPGSIRIGLRMPQQYVQEDAFHDDAPAEAAPAQALARLMEMAMWAASGADALPEDVFPDRDEAALLAAEAADLVPSTRSVVEVVSFEGALVPAEEPVRLEAPMRPRLRGLLQLLSVVAEEVVIGTIREIDLDAQRITLRERGAGVSDLKCHLPDELVDVAEELLDQRVRARGLISSATPDSMDVRELELWEVE
jgi:hypothetical protein